MKIIEPNVELWKQTDKISHVTRCARVCYGKESGNDEALYGSLERRNHLSMYRHETYYAAVPTYKKDSIVWQCLAAYIYCPYIKWVTYKNNTYIITNGNFLRDIAKDNPVLFHMIYDNQITPEEAEQIEPIWEHFMRYTFCVDTQISTSRELNRVSPNNIAEQSTRYVYEDGTICRPHWMTKEEAEYINTEPILNDDWIVNHAFTKRYIWTIDNSFHWYKELINDGLPREDARGVLPLDTATRCVYTYSVDEWFEIIKKRVYNITGKSHPNATIICKLIEQELNGLGYEVKI